MLSPPLRPRPPPSNGRVDESHHLPSCRISTAAGGSSTARRQNRARGQHGGRTTRVEVASPTMDDMSKPTRRVLLAKPRGYCAGVDRAVQTVEHALERFGAPVYVRKQIVHNTHVVRDLEKRGAIFVEETEEVPEGSVVVFSAHGVAPQVHARSEGPQASHDRCHLPAGHQGAQRGSAVRRPGLPDPADRARRPRRGRRHHRRGARQHHARRRPRRRGRDRGRGPGQTRLAVPDDAVGR